MLIVKALGWVREVTYDRGTINDDLGREALRMGECRERLRTFEDRISTSATRELGLRFTHAEALELACLGFFVPANSPVAPEQTSVKCSFCRRSLLYGPRIPPTSSTGTGSGSGGGPGLQHQSRPLFEAESRIVSRPEAYVLPQSVLQPARQDSQSSWATSDPDERVASVKWRHQLFSPTCPISIGLAGDNRKLSPEEIALYIRAMFTL